MPTSRSDVRTNLSEFRQLVSRRSSRNREKRHHDNFCDLLLERKGKWYAIKAFLKYDSNLPLLDILEATC
ncbi:11968_t:CDS:2 [Ambispora leptoticha]|uniref:11968_t:CDS:1 n=1 Tax=Ambispora leptoticha TaxID=144679 RepID=A0A9N9GY66_9GLOM|nr:11968_t:CDS:2 [Ambispora leptoticha]